MNPVYTVGHSTRSIEELVEMLRARDVTRLIDIRTVPRSRHNPQFNRDELPASLAPYGLAYEHRSALGGLRHARPDSPNTAWENASFRGYADYMLTEEFAAALQELIDTSQAETVAIMCAEAVPWRCHRRMVADALVARGIEVFHIYTAAKVEAHRLTPWARIDGTAVSYPGLPFEPE